MTPAHAVDGQHLRAVLGHYPTGVSLLTGRADDGELSGLTVGSFTLISLDPPLVGFFVGKSSTTWPRIRAAGILCKRARNRSTWRGIVDGIPRQGPGHTLARDTIRWGDAGWMRRTDRLWDRIRSERRRSRPRRGCGDGPRNTSRPRTPDLSSGHFYGCPGYCPRASGASRITSRAHGASRKPLLTAGTLSG